MKAVYLKVLNECNLNTQKGNALGAKILSILFVYKEQSSLDEAAAQKAKGTNAKAFIYLFIFWMPSFWQMGMTRQMVTGYVPFLFKSPHLVIRLWRW